MSGPFLTGAFVLAVLVAVGLMLLVRREMPAGGGFGQWARPAAVFVVVGVTFSLILTFAAGTAWSGYDGAQKAGASEALLLQRQFERAEFLPAPASETIQGQLICYGRAVAYDEWRKLGTGVDSDLVDTWSSDLLLTLKGISTTTPAEQAVLAAYLTQNEDLVAARQQRLDAAMGVIGLPLWALMLGLAALTLLLVLAFADPTDKWWAQAILMLSVAGMVVAGLLLVDMMNHPYRDGPGEIQPVEMRVALNRLDVAAQQLSPGLAVPCDGSGHAAGG